ncbi:hypothetical protein [Hymenobacter crusticola]|uniref:Peptidase A2 domain-containing protein n=1 Tax=Hymenobacter crusticola TaxID=1770526 RepID=A0A243WK03_9BACT|nr:hypothetical protein [Hymenobacter crusticola]OUJ76196.1 hypothetical protein BXP70_02710 [Hymenobacter crusticola]
MKLLLKITLVVLVILGVSGVGGYFYVRYKFQPPANQLAITGLPATCSFTWSAAGAATPALAHAALLVPIKLVGCPRTCYLQFDTGAPYSLLYAKSLAALRAAYPATQRSLTTQHDTIRDLAFTLGQGRVQARRILVRPLGMSQLPADSIPFVVGTLGTDVLADQVLVLDYPRQRFTLLQQVPAALTRQATFVPLDFANRRVLVQASLREQPQQFLFDSGSSAFSLLTSRGTWEKLAQPAATEQVAKVNSWGKILVAHTVASEAALQFATKRMPLRTVTYIEGTTLMQQALTRFSGLTGMLGNAPFDGQTIILDARGSRFGVLNN